MRLILLRHGIAEDSADSPDGSDEARRLTGEGVKRTKAVVEALAKRIDQPCVIYSSPRVRARQTADLASKAFDADVVEDVSLGFGDIPSILKKLRECKADCVMIVGHEPTFSAMTELVCFGRVSGNLILKKVGCAIVDIEFGDGDEVAGQLIALIPPSVVAGSK